jgi:hypothetical protein
MEKKEVLIRFLKAYTLMGLPESKAASFAYNGVKPFGRSWGYFAKRLLRTEEPLNVERKTDLLTDAEPADYLCYQDSMFCVLIKLGYLKLDACRLCKYKVPNNGSIKLSRFSKELFNRAEIQYRIAELEKRVIFVGATKYKPVELNDVRAIEKRLTIKQSVFCALLAKGVNYKDAAKIVGLGKTDSSNQSAGCRLAKQAHIQTYVGHLIYELNDINSLL